MKIILEKSSSRKGLIFILVAQLIVGGLLGFSLSQLAAATNGLGILDFEIGYSADRVAKLFSGYGDEGMLIYRQIQLIDLFNPLVYSILFSSLLFVFFKQSKFNWLAYLGFLCGGLDYLENAFLFIMANSYPDMNSGIVQSSSVISVVKHSILYLTIIVFMIGLIRWLVIRRKKYQTPT